MMMMIRRRQLARRVLSNGRIARPFSTVHDVGGSPRLMDTPVPADEPLHAWELEAHALFASFAKAGYFSTDESRRTIEAFPAAAYEQWGYYEKFSAAAAPESSLIAKNFAITKSTTRTLSIFRNVLKFIFITGTVPFPTMSSR